MKKTNILANTFLVLSMLLSMLSTPGYTVHAQDGSTTPTAAPSSTPTEIPTTAPTEAPTEKPTVAPTDAATQTPTVIPTDIATTEPTLVATNQPSTSPTVAQPTSTDTNQLIPSATPTAAVTFTPETSPTVIVTNSPTATQTASPMPTKQVVQFDTNNINNRYIVVFKNTTNVNTKIGTISANIVASGGKMVKTYSSVLNGFAAALPPDILAQYQKDPNVAYIERDRVVTISNDIHAPLKSTTSQPNADWGLDRIDTQSFLLDQTYHYDYTGNGVNVYIIDTGLRTDQVDFGGRATMDYDGVGDGYNTDCNGHGTYVAGLIGGATYGVAKNANLHGVRVFNCTANGSTSGIIAGIDWVTAHHTGQSVVNLSLGGPASTAEDTAVQNSIKSGLTFVVAAGNNNDNACNYSPARVPEAITVGSTGESTPSDVKTSFSNWGSCLDIFAPGAGITSDWNDSDSATKTISGTSASSALVAGVTALYLEEYPSLTPAQVANALINNATNNLVSNAGSGSPNRLLYAYYIPQSPVLTAPIAGAQMSTLPTLTWNTTADAATYEVQVATNAGMTQTQIVKDVTISDTNLPLSGLIANVHYYWRVLAQNDMGVSGPWSSVKDFIFDTTGPMPPVLLAPANLLIQRGPGTTSFSWTAPVSATVYQLEYSTDSNFINNLTSFQTSATNINVPTPVRGTYYWQVRAKDLAGNWGAYSTPNILNIHDSIPATPTISGPASGAPINSANLSWTVVPNAGSYEVQYSISSTFVSGNVNVPGITTSNTPTPPFTYILPMVLGDAHYYWRVRAVNADNEAGVWSTARDFIMDRTPPAVPALSAPPNASILRGVTSFSWSAPSTAVGYKFEYSATPDFNSPALSVLLTSTTYNLNNTGLVKGTYYWHVSAKDTAGNWSSFSPYNTFLIHDPIPGTVTLKGPANGYQSLTPSDLSWSVTSNGSSYDLQYSTTISFDPNATTLYSGINISTTQPPTFTLPFPTSLADGQYYWRIRGVNADNDLGAWSAIGNFIIDTTGPVAPVLSAPADLSVQRTGNILFSWLPSTTAVGYQFEYGTDPSFSSKLLSTTTSTTSYTVSSLGRNTYYWHVRAKDALGNWGNYSKPYTLYIHDFIPATPKPASPLAGFQTRNNEPTLTWVMASSASTYDVQYSTSSSFDSSLTTMVTGINALNYVYNLPLLDGHYYWQVRGDNVDGDPGAWSSALDFTVITVGPASPNLTSPADSSTLRYTFPFTWTENDSWATGYRFEYSTAPDVSSPILSQVVTSNNITLTITVKGTYYWHVAAKDALGNWGYFSAPQSFYAQTPLPDVPTLNLPNAGFDTANNAPFFSWSAVTYANSYDLQISTSPTFTSGNTLFSGLWTSTTLNNPLGDGHYYWQVRGVNSDNEPGNWSTTKDFIVDTSGPAAPVVTSPGDNTITRGTVSFAWSPATTAIKYHVEISQDAFTSPSIYTAIDTDPNATNPTSTSYAIAWSLTSPTTYYWRVYGIDAAGKNGPWSSIYRFRVYPPLPTMPTLDSPVAHLKTNVNTPSFSWETANNADTYDLQYSKSSTFASGNTLINVTGTSITLSSALTNEHYFWHVRGVNGIYQEAGPWSATQDFTVDAAAPGLTAPVNNAILRGTGTTTFSWTAPASAVGYQFEYSTASNFSSPIDIAVTGTSTSLSNPARGVYYWHVQAKDVTDHWGVWSATYIFVVKDPIPGLPTLIAPTAGIYINSTSSPLTFNWSTATSANTYDLQYSTSSTFATGNTLVNVADITKTLATLPVDGHYYWHTRGVNLDNEAGAWSATRDFIVDTVAPAAPSLTAPLDTSILRGTTIFSWSAPATAVGYQFDYNTALDFSGTDVTVSLTSPSTTLNNPARGSYYWRVQAKDTAGNWSTWSKTNGFTVKAPLPVTPTLSSPAAGAVFNSYTNPPSLSWAVTLAPNTFDLQYSTSATFTAGSTTTINGITPGAPTTYALTVPADGHYYWQVRGINIDNEIGSWSAARDFYVDTQAPLAPVLNTPADAGIVNGATLFGWSAPATAAGYQLEYSTDSNFSSPTDVTQTGTSYSISNLPRNTYYWHVKAKDAAGNWSAYSSPQSFNVHALIPGSLTISSPAAGFQTTANPLLKWTAANNATSYELQYSTSAIFASNISTNITGVSTTIGGATLADGTYYWRVRGLNADLDPGPWSNTGSFVLDTTGPIAPTLKTPANDATIAGNPSFTWSTSATATGYIIGIGSINDPNSITILSTTLSTTSYTPSAILPVGDNYWWVKARDALGNWGSWSTSNHVIITPLAPAAPTLISPATATLTNTNPVVLSWNKVSYGASYNIQYSDSAAFPNGDNTIVNNGSSNGSANLSLTDGKYYWRVQAVNSNNITSPWSGALYFTLDTQAPAIPTLSLPADTIILYGTTTFSWAASATATNYLFEYSTDINFTNPAPIDAMVSGTSYSLTNPARNTYYWHVKAKDAAGNWSVFSSTRTFTVHAPIPGVPTLTNPAAGLQTTATSPVLSWSAASNASSYELQYSTDSTFASNNDVGGLATISTTLKSLSDNHYYWRVRGINADNDAGNWSATRDFTVDTTGPLAPALISPTDTSIVHGTTSFTWAASITAVGYQFEYDTDAGFSTPAPTIIAVAGTSTSISNPTRNAYYWQVRAKDALGNWGNWSNPYSFIVHAPIPGVPTLTNPAASLQTTVASPVLSWSTTASASTYELEYSTDSTFVSNNDLSGLGLTTTLSNLSDGHYYWRVRAANLDGDTGNWSATRDFTIDTTGPLAPALIAPINGSINHGTTSFSWNASATAVGYQLEYGTDPNFTSPTPIVVAITGTSTSLTNLPRNTYYWQVRAKDALGNWGLWSSPNNFVVYAPVPGVPGLITPTGLHTESLTPTLTWNTISGDTYDIQVNSDPAFQNSSTENGGSGLSNANYTTPSLDYGKWYWRVRAVSPDGEAGAWSTSNNFIVYPTFNEGFDNDSFNWLLDNGNWYLDGYSDLATDGNCASSTCGTHTATYTAPLSDFSDFTLQARLSRNLNEFDTTNFGFKTNPYGVFFRADVNLSSGAINSGYVFWYSFNNFTQGYSYQVLKYTGGSVSIIKNWTVVPNQENINWGNFYNVGKVVAAGNTFNCYINNTLVYTFTDGSYIHGKVGLIMSPYNGTDETLFADWVKIGMP